MATNGHTRTPIQIYARFKTTQVDDFNLNSTFPLFHHSIFILVPNRPFRGFQYSRNHRLRGVVYKQVGLRIRREQ